MAGGTRKLRTQYVASIRVFADVFRNPDLRRVQLAFVGFTISELATFVAIGVFAYQTWGATAVGVVSLLLLLPSAIVAPFAAGLADRHRRERVLVAAYLAQAATTGLTALALLEGWPNAVVIVLSMTAASSLTLVRPAQSALLPSIARTPTELTAANVAIVTTRNFGLLAGPLVASLILGPGSPGAVYAAMAALMLLAAGLTASISRTPRPAAAKHPHSLRTATAGFRTVLHEPRARVIVLLLTSKFFVQGLLRVLLVVVAIGVLGLGNRGVGWLNAALGVGGAIGGSFALLLIGRRRLSPAFGVGILLWGIPLVLLGVWPTTVVALVLLGFAGTGRSLMDVSGRTLLARIAPEDSLARVFGVLESLYMAALAAGSAVAALLLVFTGPRTAVVIAGVVLPLVALVMWRALARSDRGPVVASRQLERILSVPMFAPLSPEVIERLAANLDTVVVTEGSTIIRQGDVGDRFFILDEGRAQAKVDGRLVAEFEPGDYFGEIALLRDVPRTASVLAVGDVRLYELSRDEFLLAITGEPESVAAADAVVDVRSPQDAARDRTSPPA